VQTVGDDSNPEFRRILEAFYERTGCALLVNTSFNVRGEPIVCSPQDAYDCFLRTDIDLLVLEDRVLWKSLQPRSATSDDRRPQYDSD
jgi:carbamoyltransferase